MRMDETIDRDPAEFLFGKLASNLLASESGDYVNPGPPSKVFEFKLMFLQLLYAGFVIFSGYLFFTYFEGSSRLYTTLMVLPFILLSSMKSQLLYSKFAPDLETRMSRPTSFVVSQQLLVIAGSFIFLTGFWLILSLYNSRMDPTTIFAILLLITLIYIKIFSDLALSSLALGIGVIPSWGGIRNLFGNLSELVQVKGRYTTRLAFSRIILALFSYYLFLRNLDPIYFFVSTSIFILYTRSLEKRNAASLLLNARGWIQSIAPAIIPVKILEAKGNGELNPNRTLSDPANILSTSYSEKLFGKKSSSSTRRVLEKGNKLTSYATQTINRIANTIRSEQVTLPSNISINCFFCSANVIKGSRYCPDCGSAIQ